MAAQERPADAKAAGWRVHVPVYLGIVGGVLLLLAIEVVGSIRPIPQSMRDAGLIVGGALTGLVVFLLDELYGRGLERERLEHARLLERARHQEERRLDFEQYRELQAELRESRSRVATLQAKVDLGGAIDRDWVGDALLLGFYFHRRGERLPSSTHRSIFKTAAFRLKLIPDEKHDLTVDKAATHDILQISYGPVIAEAFDLGYLLSHLGENGLPATISPEIVAELEKHLRDLKIDPDGRAYSGFDPNSGVFKRLAARIISIVRRKV